MFFCEQKTAYEMRISDWSSDVCSSDLVDFTIERFDGLHVMFNNAGISGAQHPRFLYDDLSDFQRVIGINLFGVMTGCQYAAKHMANKDRKSTRLNSSH